MIRYGVRGTEINWFKSYLSSRKQFCSVIRCESTVREVTCGIPQGSCLGPLLFILYLNDFEECLQFSRASIYADDIHVTAASSDIEEVMQMKKELSDIADWMRVNKLSAIPQKIEFMVIDNPR